MNHLTHRILVVDDTPAIHEDFRKILAADRRDAGSRAKELAAAIFEQPAATAAGASFAVDSAHQGEEALTRVTAALAEGRPYAVAFVDMRMPPGWDGIETVRRLWAVDPRLETVICTAYSDESWTSITAQLGITDKLIILKKPFDSVEVLQLAHALTTKWVVARRVENQVRELDVLARGRAAALESAEQWLRAAFLGNPHGLALISLPEGQVLESNPAFAELDPEPASLPGRRLAELACWQSPADLENLVATLAQGRTPPEIEVPVQLPGGRRGELRLSAYTFREREQTHAVLRLHDVTERRRLERQLRQAQKMEAIGGLAAGIAHDFNNLLTVILGYSSGLLADASLGATARADVEAINEAGLRASALTRQLLVFSRQQPMQRQPLDPAEAVRGLQKMLSRLVGETISVDWEIASCPPILADASNLEQIVANLVLNARDALPRGGTIRVALRPVEVAPADVRRHPDARAGHHVRLVVQDDGEGMSPEVQAHLFEPFFTTKGPERGTGLGLSTVYGITRQHEGWIEVESAPGRGSTFSLYFPAYRQETIAPPAAPAPAPVPPPASKKRILAVEDDPGVRNMLATILRINGYAVTLACHGPEALQLWHDQLGQFDLLLSDMVMPGGMTGVDVAKALRRENPRLPVLLATGYSDQLTSGLELGDGGPPPQLLRKPYDAPMVAQALRTALA